MSGGGSQVQESPLQKAQAQVANQQWSDYNSRFLPAQEFYINRTQANQPARKELAEGMANADVQGQFGNAQTGLNAAMAKRGAMPGSGASVFGDTALATSKGGALGMGRTNTDDAITRQYQGALRDIVSMGQGQQATTNTDLGVVAGIQGDVAAQQAQVAEQDAAGLGQAVGTGVGIGGGYGMRALTANPGTPAGSGIPAVGGGFNPSANASIDPAYAAGASGYSYVPGIASSPGFMAGVTGGQY